MLLALPPPFSTLSSPISSIFSISLSLSRYFLLLFSSSPLLLYLLSLFSSSIYFLFPSTIFIFFVFSFNLRFLCFSFSLLSFSSPLILNLLSSLQSFVIPSPHLLLLLSFFFLVFFISYNFLLSSSFFSLSPPLPRPFLSSLLLSSLSHILIPLRLVVYFFFLLFLVLFLSIFLSLFSLSPSFLTFCFDAFFRSTVYVDTG